MTVHQCLWRCGALAAFFMGSTLYSRAGTELWDLAQANLAVHRFSTLLTAQDVRDRLATEAGIGTAIDWCKRTAVTKVYLETFRDGYQAERTALEKVRDRFRAATIEVAIGFTSAATRSSGRRRTSTASGWGPKRGHSRAPRRRLIHGDTRTFVGFPLRAWDTPFHRGTPSVSQGEQSNRLLRANRAQCTENVDSRAEFGGLRLQRCWPALRILLTGIAPLVRSAPPLEKTASAGRPRRQDHQPIATH